MRKKDQWLMCSLVIKPHIAYTNIILLYLGSGYLKVRVVLEDVSCFDYWLHFTGSTCF